MGRFQPFPAGGFNPYFQGGYPGYNPYFNGGYGGYPGYNPYMVNPYWAAGQNMYNNPFWAYSPIVSQYAWYGRSPWMYGANPWANPFAMQQFAAQTNLGFGQVNPFVPWQGNNPNVPNFQNQRPNGGNLPQFQQNKGFNMKGLIGQ